MSSQELHPRSLRSLHGWDYLLFAEMIHLCRLLPKILHLDYADFPPCPQRFIWSNKGYAVLEEQSNWFFEHIGLLRAVTSTHNNENEIAAAPVHPNSSHDSSTSAKASTPNNSSFDGSEAASSHTGTTHADSTEVADSDDNDEDGSEWQTASSIHSSDDPIRSRSSSSNQVHNTTSFQYLIEEWREVAIDATAFRAVYARNLPSGLSALPLYHWRTYEVVRAALVGALRIFSRIQNQLLYLCEHGRWDGTWLWSLVYRAAEAQAAEDVHDEGGRARAVARSILGRVMVLCCPWDLPGQQEQWVAVVVGWIGALIEHQAGLEVETGASGDEEVSSKAETEAESDGSEVDDQAYGSDEV